MSRYSGAPVKRIPFFSINPIESIDSISGCIDVDRDLTRFEPPHVADSHDEDRLVQFLACRRNLAICNAMMF
jgi:hypothetical protein